MKMHRRRVQPNGNKYCHTMRRVLALLLLQSIFGSRCSERLRRSLNDFDFGGGIFGSPLRQPPFGSFFGGGGDVGLGFGSQFGAPFPFTQLPFPSPFGAPFFPPPPPFSPPPLYPPPPLPPHPPPPPAFVGYGPGLPPPQPPIIIPAKTAVTISIASLLHALIARKSYPPIIPFPYPRPVPFPYPVKVPVPIPVDSRPAEYTVLKTVAFEAPASQHEHSPATVEEWSPTEIYPV